MMNNTSPITLILFYCGQRTGNFGAGSHIGSLLPFIKEERSIRFIVIQTDDKDAERVGFEKIDGVEVLRIPQPENKLFLASAQDFIQQTYAKRLVEIIYPYIKEIDNPVFWVNSIDYLNVCFELKEHLDCQLLYVHHAWSWKIHYNVCDEDFVRIYRKNGSPNASTAIEFTRYQQAIAMLADQVVTVTDQAKSFFTRYLDVPTEKVSTIYNGIDMKSSSGKIDKSALRKRLGIPEGEKVILFTGRIKADKGLGYLLEAFKKVLEVEPTCRLVLVGKGDFDEFIPLVYPYSTKVTFTGKLPKEEVNDWYRLADVGVLPSLHEQCSYTAIEMRFFQIPIIVSSVEGLEDMFRHEHDALKLTIHYDQEGKKTLDSDEIANNILRLCNDQELGIKLKKNGLEEAENHFTSHKMWEQYWMLLQEMQGTHIPLSDRNLELLGK
ncbi:glycosyltransferase [Echinicola marina]|uniref:glycosyltransferase n=1 Tax=Echinicola marina TaxID=2859768 RepID=UPI001CF6899E|nr:glycosyltransferase [Echinicola marina]UCS95062.1 glycosyltransferase [Echinicola marina]